MSSYCGIINIGDVKTMKDNRLFRILYYILEKGKVTASELADKFEVSVRTIYRDIDSISSAGIPIYALQGKGYFRRRQYEQCVVTIRIGIKGRKKQNC